MLRCRKFLTIFFCLYILTSVTCSYAEEEIEERNGAEYEEENPQAIPAPCSGFGKQDEDQGEWPDHDSACV